MGLNEFNPVDYADGAKVLGIAMIILGAGLLIFMATLTSRKGPKSNRDN